MGYYADLIKQKQENQNANVFPVPGTVRELKTRAEVERYMFEQRREVDKCISWMESTKKKIQEIEKEPKPHSIGWAERLRSAQGSYKQYKRWMEMHEDFAARAEDWLSKNRNSKDNEKEEKDNESTVEKFDHYGSKIEIIKTDSGKFRFRVSKKGNFKESMTVSTLSEARRDAIKQAETWANEKEEKDNGRIEEMYREIQELKKKGLSSTDIDKYYAAINYRKTAEQYMSEFKKTKNTDYKYAAEGQLRKAEQLEREYKKHLHNSDEEKGYYAKLAEEKAERKNYKFTDKEISDYLKSNPSQAKQYVRKKTAGKAENITIHPETLTAELDENGKTHLFKFVSDESLGFILKYMGTK